MKKLRIQLMTLLITGTGMIFNTSFAYDIDDIENIEIVHLIEFIGNADCRFVRNGEEYSSTHARMFIEYKYDNAKDEIYSTEDFIKTAATKSSSSGLDYKVRCNGGEAASAHWLTKELASYRSIVRAN